MEQIRIAKEMRERDVRNGRSGVNIRPRYMVWENVPGAFSSNKSEDFRIVLEELAKIKNKNAVIPRPADGKWRTSGCILGDGWSIAWRVLDTQFWGLSYYLDDGGILVLGTPQRRKRISLVADFGGQSAPEILFNRKSVSGHINESNAEGKQTSSNPTRGVGTGGSGIYVVENHTADSRVKVDESGVVQTLTSRMGTSGGNVPLVMTFAKSRRAQSDTDFESWKESGIANTLNLFDQGDVRATNVVVQCKPRYVVRRLTPLECERLQGYPDGWTDIGEWTDSNGKKRQTSDAARYKALGNSIALPPWKWVLKRLCACYERDASMASLFDGIGGFPYLWEQLNGKGSCLWASEIEAFPMAVTKVRIGG